MRSDKVNISKSEIHGKGVFALHDFKKGEVVLHWDTSKTIPKNEFEAMPEKAKRYVNYLDSKYVIMQEPERYVNHSCNSNTTSQNFCDIAIKDIKKGDEITANYIEAIPPNTEMKCNCGSKNCKKIIKSK